MRISKYFVALSLLAGGLAPIALGANSHNETKAVSADSVKDLSTIISTGNRSFSTSYIGNFFFDFTLSEQIFSKTGYLNDHINEFLDENSQPINFGDGIVINGQTFAYWINYQPETVSYPRNDGVVAFPLYASKTFNPVAIEVTANKIAFKVNLDYFPMDSIIVTFKAGIFKGYYNGTKYALNEDLTFYSTLNDEVTSSNSNKITFVRERHETIINAKINTINDWGEKENSQGGKYHRYVLWTNIPHDKGYVPDVYPATHYRFAYDNYLYNEKPFTYYNTWVRGNMKDFTNLSDKTSITKEYEAAKPGGAISVNECLALTFEHPSDQDNYVAIVYVPNQILIDFSLESSTFALREGSAWYTFDENGNQIIGRIDKAAFNQMITNAVNELENYVDLSNYEEAEKLEISAIISDAQVSMLNAFTKVGLDKIVEDTKAAIDAVKTSGEMLEQEHINAVVSLIDAIILPVEYNEACGASINVAKEGFATLTSSEIAKFPSEKINKLYEAYSEYTALDLANYKALSKAEINTLFNLEDYRELEQSAINDLLETANALIDEANSKQAVQELVDGVKLFGSLVKTDKQLSLEELNNAKAIAKAELDAINLDAYRSEERAQVVELINNGKAAIEACESVSEVETLLAKIKAVIASIKTDADYANAHAAQLVKIAKQRTTILTISVVGGSLAILAGIGLTVLFIRKRKAN